MVVAVSHRYQSIDPPQLVQVRHDGIWHQGWLTGWGNLNGRWRAHVDWLEGPGLRHRAVYDEADVRPPDDPGTGSGVDPPVV